METTLQIPSVFRAPAPSRATRTISLRSKASLRGALVAQLPADKTPRKIMFESKLEHKFLLLTLARLDVHDIWDQPKAIKYKARNGKVKLHTFDYLVTFKNGEKVAVAIKPSALVIKYGFVAELGLIAAAAPLWFTDRVILITERNLDKIEVRNAAMFHDFRKSPDANADDLLKHLLAELREPISISDLVIRSGFGGRMFQAIVLAIYRDQIIASKKTPIDYSTSISVRTA